MSNLVEIKKRIASITSTIKVTKVMQMIATAKIAKIKQMIPVVDRYDNYANNILGSYIKNTANLAEIKKYYTENKNNKNLLFILLSSDKGTCGSINTNIFKEITSLIKENQEKGCNITILPIGKKAIKFVEDNMAKLCINMYKLDKHIDAENCKSEEINDIVRKVITSYNNNEFGKVYFVFHKFKNIITCEAVNQLLLPIDKKQVDTTNTKFINIIEDDKTASSIIEFFVRTKLYNAYISNLSSIISSRMNAMDNATKNGQEIIDDLRIKYNKGRQASITSELSDIVSGFEAIS